MAEGVESALFPPAPAEPLVVPPPSARRRRAYGRRFLLAYLVLGVFAGAAVMGSVALLAGDGPEEEVAWSAWRPEGERATYPQQIAEYVGLRYRKPDDRQLVAVLAGPPVLPISTDVSLEVTHVAITKTNGDVQLHEVGEDGVIYRLCGLGDNCAIPADEASDDQDRLLRRQALELALYSFKYMDDTDTVVVQLPPPPDSAEQSGAVFFRRSELEAQLDAPLISTLERANPPAVIARINPIESVKIDRLTQPRLFSFDYRLTPDATGFVLLLSRGQS